MELVSFTDSISVKCFGLTLHFRKFAVRMSVSLSLTSMPPLMVSNNTYTPLNKLLLLLINNLTYPPRRDNLTSYLLKIINLCLWVRTVLI